MNKKEFIKLISSETKTYRHVVDRVIDSFIYCLRDRLIRGDKVKITGLGTFELIRTNRMFYRNPQTGEQVPEAGKLRVKFVPSRLLKNKIEK